MKSTGPPVAERTVNVIRTLPAQPPILGPHPDMVDPGEGWALTKLICVAPVAPPGTTWLLASGDGRGDGVGAGGPSGA